MLRICRFRLAPEIRLAGKVDPEIVEAITEAGLGAQLRLLGYLPHPESVAELRQADIILLPLRHSPEYSKVYPGKIFECMAAGPFVLGIGPTDSAAAELLASTDTGVMIDWSDGPAGIIRETEDSCVGVFADGECRYRAPFSGARTCLFPVADSEPAVSGFSRRALTVKLADLLATISK